MKIFAFESLLFVTLELLMTFNVFRVCTDKST